MAFIPLCSFLLLQNLIPNSKYMNPLIEWGQWDLNPSIKWDQLSYEYLLESNLLAS